MDELIGLNTRIRILSGSRWRSSKINQPLARKIEINIDVQSNRNGNGSIERFWVLNRQGLLLFHDVRKPVY